jgi:hypothetical protein
MLSLRITASVGKLLRCFRLQNRPRILRIGDLCIDQESEMNKTRQILLMGKIHQEATDVLIWLGFRDKMTRHHAGWFLRPLLKTTMTIN